MSHSTGRPAIRYHWYSAEVPQLSLQSAQSLFLEVSCNGYRMATATGFVVKRGRWRYLITNWHVVAGRDPGSGRLLSSRGAMPDELAILHNVAGNPGAWEFRREPLYRANGTPRWREHPLHGRAVDVVALPLSALDETVAVYPYDPWDPGPPIAVAVSSTLYVVGFPFGLTGGGGLGIWAKGSVATEPDIDYNDLPALLIDSRTRQGQSGSPVIAHHFSGGVAMQDGGQAFFAGPVTRLAGVYSGRISRESDLGFVWKLSALIDILESGVGGSVTV